MNFEHALEAMRHGNKVRRKGYPDTLYFIDDGFIKVFDRATEESIIVDFFDFFRCATALADEVLADDWEIYEEQLKKPEMTAGHAIEVLETIRRACKLIPDVDEVIDFSVEVIGKQNQTETANNLNSDNESANVKHAHEKYDDVIRNLHILLDFYKDNDFYSPKIIDAIEALKRDAEPEKKCACHCKEKSIFTTDELVETASKIIDFMHWLTGDEDDE